MRRDGALLFNSGYAANTGILTALLRAGDMVFSDELNHASIIDGCRLSRAEIVVFPHRDLGSLERALTATSGRRRVVISESLFSMDGDIADVEGLARTCRDHNAAFILDEAHAVGVHGREGAGIAFERGVVPDVVVGTLGKAVGVFGAFAATSSAIAELLLNRARPFVFSTGLPPAIAAAASCSIDLIRGNEGEQRRRRLRERVIAFRHAIPRSGGSNAAAIAPVHVGNDERVVQLSTSLLAAGVFVPAIRPPTVPEGSSRLRVSLSAGLSMPDLSKAAKTMEDSLARFT
jgi:8-amino-7-oxononanoate synthase